MFSNAKKGLTLSYNSSNGKESTRRNLEITYYPTYLFTYLPREEKGKYVTSAMPSLPSLTSFNRTYLA
jgi:hypothetical protein